jgi:hypothetical protein
MEPRVVGGLSVVRQRGPGLPRPRGVGDGTGHWLGSLTLPGPSQRLRHRILPGTGDHPGAIDRRGRGEHPLEDLVEFGIGGQPGGAKKSSPWYLDHKAMIWLVPAQATR